MSLQRISGLIILVALSATLPAQEARTPSRRVVRLYEEARLCYTNFDQQCAEDALLKVLKADPEFIEAHRLLAQICYEQGRMEEAIGHFSRSLELDPEGNPEGYRLLAQLVIMTGDYEQTLELVRKYLFYPPEMTPARQAALLLEKKCLFALEALRHPVPFHPERLGEGVNSPYNEYWPSLSVDEQMLMFTVMLPIDPAGGIDPRNLNEDLFFATRSANDWSERVNAGVPLNTINNEGAHSMTADGGTLYFTACNRADGIGMCDIYQSTLRDGKWTTPVNLGIAVNTRYSEKHPSVSADGRRLYFTSDRPGGRGSYDIWMTEWTGNGWNSPVNLGDSVNTPGLEQSPFIHPDQQSLYFSSTGWTGMGQGDLFLCRKLPGSGWSGPVNLGYPINTFSDEIGFSVSARGDRAYFASDRFSGTDTDLYTFELPPEIRPVPVSYMRGRVFDAGTMRGIVAQIQLIDLETGENVMELPSRAGEGDYLVSLPSERDYALNVSAEGYLFYSEHFAFMGIHSRVEPMRRDIPMEKASVGSSIILQNVFFETDSHQLLPSSVTELNKVFQFLKGNPNLEIEIIGHTDNTGRTDYNQLLSERRALSVVDYLAGQGIPAEQLKYSGQGDREPVADNNTPEGRARNRRTELLITGILPAE